MKRLFVFVVVFFAVCLVAPPITFSDEDIPDYKKIIFPNFKLEGKNYGKFYTPVYEVTPKLDYLLISVAFEKSSSASLRTYIRFKYENTGRWTHFVPFDNEFHFTSLQPISAYQLLFVVLDLGQGKNIVKRVTVQGRRMGREILEELLKNNKEFVPALIWPKPTIISRSEWNARPPKADYTPHIPQKIVLHHSWSPTQAQYNGAATIRGIQNYHMDSQATGWIDIGYHFLIGPDGAIYQGRPEEVIGSHAPPNKNMVGICIIGNYDPNADKINEKIEKSLIDLLCWLSSKYKIDPRLYYYGHRNFSSKTCPGDIVYDRLPHYREEVLKNIGEIPKNK